MDSPGKQLMESFLADDHASVARLLEQYPGMRTHLNEGVFDGQMPPLAAAKSHEMVDVLMDHGARVEKVSEWWAPGFYAHQVDPMTARHLVNRGAQLTVHAATGIGLVDVVQEMLDREPTLSRAAGGDG